jgi:hypothetical protein
MHNMSCRGAQCAGHGAGSGVTVPASGRRGQRPLQRATANGNFQGGEPQPVMLNAQTVWMQAGGTRPVLFGEDYVLFPPPPHASAAPASASSSGLVPWRRPGTAPLAVVPAGERGIIPFNGDPVVLRGGGFIEAEVVDAEVLPAEPPALAGGPPAATTTTALAPRPAATSGGIVPCAAGQPFDGDAFEAAGGEDAVYEAFSHSPRRGHKIRFRCKRCGATSIKPINIHAWREGTVFARCGRCHVTHKLIDNLKLFHEMAGPVFDPPAPPLSPATPLPPALKLRLEELGGGGGGAVGGAGSVGGWPGFNDWPRSEGGGDA